MRPRIVTIVLFVLLALPSWAAADPADLLARYGHALKVVNQRHQVVSRLLDLVTEDQRSAFEQLRVSPSQARAIGKLLQGRDLSDWEQVRTDLSTELENILGPEQFDLVLELTPSPIQKERARAILEEASNTPEGAWARQCADELEAALSEEQRQELSFLLDLVKPSSASPVAPEPGAVKGRPERRLVRLQKNSLGEFFAEITPELDYGRHLPAHYRVVGGDANVLAAVAGLPVRLLGVYEGDVVRVAETKLLGPPPVLAVSGVDEVWRGRLPARVVSPGQVEVDLGRGRTLTASVGSELSGEFLLDGTFLVDEAGSSVVDYRTQPLPAAPAGGSARWLVQLSEPFLESIARQYLEDNDLAFGTVAVKDAGISLRDVSAGQARLFAVVSASQAGLPVFEGHIEVLVVPSLSQGKLALAPVPGSLALRSTFPLEASAPASWIAALERTMGAEYLSGMAVEVPSSKWFSEARFLTLSTPDRRTSLLAVASSQGSAVDPLRSRITAPAQFAVSLSEELINEVVQEELPGQLPILRDIPPDLELNQAVKLTKLEVTELELAFRDGLFRIDNCALALHWRWGLFGGVEPAARFSGTARVDGSGDPLDLKARLDVETLEFLSERIHEQTPEEQQELKDKMIKVIREHPVDLPAPSSFSLGSWAAVRLTSVASQASPSELVMEGRLEP